MQSTESSRGEWLPHTVRAVAKGHGRSAAGTGRLLIGLGLGAAGALALFREGSRAYGNGPDGFGAAGSSLTRSRTVTLVTSVTIRRPAHEIYRFWRDLRNLPSFMQHLDAVSETGGHSLWKVRGPAGLEAEWKSEFVADLPGERLEWRSLAGADIPNHGSVEFREAASGLGTEVHLELVFETPGGATGAALARMLEGIPEQSMTGDLQRLKQLMEEGDEGSAQGFQSAQVAVRSSG